MGGLATLASYGGTADEALAGRNQVPMDHAAWRFGLHVAIDLRVGGQRHWLVHGGIPGDIDLRGLEPAEVVPNLARARAPGLMWRANDLETTLPLDRPIIMGHRQVPSPLCLGHVIAIDTGAANLNAGRLTALLLPERRFLTVEQAAPMARPGPQPRARAAFEAGRAGFRLEAAGRNGGLPQATRDKPRDDPRTSLRETP